VTTGEMQASMGARLQPYMKRAEDQSPTHATDLVRRQGRVCNCLAKLNQPLVWTCRAMQLLEGKSGQPLIRAISPRRLIRSHTTPSRACMLFCSKDWFPRPLG